MKRRVARTEVLVFGENPNDSKAIKELVEYHHPGLGPGVQVRVMRDPISLTRDAGARARTDWASKVRAVVRATQAAGVEVRAVFIHQDADGPDNGPDCEAQIEKDFAALTKQVDGMPVVPVVMIESWWFLFPEAIEAVKQSWRGLIPRQPQNVEYITEPKKELQRRTRGDKPQHQYAESDSPAIAAKVRELGLTLNGSSASYDRFVARIQTI